MPVGGTPPDLGLPQPVFDALHGMAYDSANRAFKSGSNLYFMFAETKPGVQDGAQWFYGTNAEGGINPKGFIPQITYDVIHNGTYNPSNGTVSYSGSNYRIRLMRDTTGKPWAEAHAV